MSSLVGNRVQETSAVVGTGIIGLTGATSPEMNEFGSAFSNGALCGYVVLNLAIPTEWEQGIGTYSSRTIARTYVLAGSNGTSPVNFSAGAKIVLNAPPPPNIGQAYDASQVYSPGDTVIYSSTTWYALAVSQGSTPATGNTNWTALGGGGGGGGVASVVAGSGISVDDTDPANPVVSTAAYPLSIPRAWVFK